MTKNAIIFSKNEKITKLIAIELMLADHSVEAVTDFSSTTKKDFSVIAVDLTSFEFTSNLSSFLLAKTTSVKICISNNGLNERVAACFDCHLGFPFLLEDLRKAVLFTNSKTNKPADDQQISSKLFVADKDRKGITFNNVYVALSPYEFLTLELLCKNTNECVSRDQIKKIMNSSDGNIADVYISHLRNKLEKSFGAKVIYTVRSKGYMTDYSMSYDLMSNY